jgi:hypothetical protein
LYLVDIKLTSPYGELGLGYIFPHRVGKIQDVWFTGEIQIPLGDLLRYEFGCDPVHESDWFISIKIG